jgi:hypothetical protein
LVSLQVTDLMLLMIFFHDDIHRDDLADAALTALLVAVREALPATFAAALGAAFGAAVCASRASIVPGMWPPMTLHASDHMPYLNGVFATHFSEAAQLHILPLVHLY